MKNGWNYRLCAEDFRDDILFSLREVYYDDNGIPTSYSAQPMDSFYLSENEYLSGTPQQDFLEYIELIKQAAEKPILWIGDRWGEEYKEMKPEATNPNFTKVLNSITPDTEQKVRKYIKEMKDNELDTLFEALDKMDLSVQQMKQLMQFSIEKYLSRNSLHLSKQIDVDGGMILYIATPKVQYPYIAYVLSPKGKYVYAGQAPTQEEAEDIVQNTYLV